MKEVFLSFAVFLFCISVTIYSQFNSPKPVNAAQNELISNTDISLNKSTVKKVNLFEIISVLLFVSMGTAFTTFGLLNWL